MYMPAKKPDNVVLTEPREYMHGDLIHGRQSLIANAKEKARQQTQWTRERNIEYASIPDGEIPTKGVKPIPYERPKNARDTDTKSPNRRKKIASSKPTPCQSAIWQIVPELTEHDNNYDEIQNRQISRIPVAQSKLKETKHLNNTNANISIGGTFGPTFLEKAGEDNKYTREQKRYPAKPLRNQKSMASRT